MNSIELDVEMKRHHDTGQDLANYLGIAPQTFSNKKQGIIAEFTQTEICLIAKRYNLTAERIVEIFFDHKCLN